MDSNWLVLVSETYKFEEILVMLLDVSHWLRIVPCIKLVCHILVTRNFCSVMFISLPPMLCLTHLILFQRSTYISHVCQLEISYEGSLLSILNILYSKRSCFIRQHIYYIFTQLTLYLLHHILALLQEFDFVFWSWM